MEYKSSKQALSMDDIAALKKIKNFFIVITCGVTFGFIAIMSVVLIILGSGGDMLIPYIMIGFMTLLLGAGLFLIYKSAIEPYSLDITSNEKICHEGIVTKLTKEMIRTNPGVRGHFRFRQFCTTYFAETPVLAELHFYKDIKEGKKYHIEVAKNSETTFTCNEVL